MVGGSAKRVNCVTMRKPKNTIIIVGGGASGTLVAANLLRRSRDVLILLIDRTAEPGRGMAYSTTCPCHLLNVPAAKMSAFPDEPAHFVRWLWRNGMDFEETSFVPRMIYGDYLQAVLKEARNQASDIRFRHIRATAEGLLTSGDRVQVRCGDGNHFEGDALVLALGNASPAPWPHLSAEVTGTGRFFGSTWDPEALQPRDPSEPVLLLGTGLTAVDALLALRHNGHRGHVHMTSRRGLLPLGHRLFTYAPIPCTPASSARELLRNMRATAADAEILHSNWRLAVDGVRPQTNHLWQSMTATDQSRFLRHVRPFWDVHRHRMAPEIAAHVEEELERGSLSVSAGRTGKIDLTANCLRIEFRARGTAQTEVIEAGRIVNCTGPEANLQRLPNPLIQDMLSQRLLQPHPLRTGALVDSDGAVITSDGQPSQSIFTVGPLRMGTLFETVAMPEIRQQASDLAGLLIGSPAPNAEDFLSSFAYAI